MSSPIETHLLSKTYGRHVGLQDVTLEVPSGSIVGLLGPNGSGKTTLMRMLMGLISISSGEARLFGRSVSAIDREVRRHVGYLPGTFKAYDNITVGRYLRYLSDLRRGDFTKNVAALCDRFSLDPSKSIGGLSKGTKQKVGLVQAFMHEPSLLILDEPTSGLDPLMQREFEALLAAVVADGATALLSSHVMSEVERMARTIAVLDKGRLVSVATVNEVKQHVPHDIDIDFGAPPDIEPFRNISGVKSVESLGNSLHLTVFGEETELIREASRQGATAIRTHEPTLDDLFESLLARTSIDGQRQ